MIETSQLTAALLIVADNLDLARENALGVAEDAARAKLNLRNLAAHVPEPTSDPDEWVRVDVDTMIPEGVDFSKTSTNTWRVHKGHGPVYVRRSDLDKLTPPDPAKALAEALTSVGEEVWTAADVRAALKSAGLTLGAEK